MARTELRRRIVRIGLIAVGGVLALSSPLWGSYIGKHIAWLDVERVEISGTRLLAPHEVLEASGIRHGQHLLDERERWEAALLAHPMIERATVTRRPPNTLRVRIEEKQPIAFVDDGTLRPATGAGEVLPLDPTAVPLDLPIVHGTFADSAGAASLHAVLAETERLMLLDPLLMAEVSEIRGAGNDPGLLVMLHPLGEILLPFGATPERTAQLRAALQDVRRRFGAESDEDSLRRRLRLDLRFTDQIVVGPSPFREFS